MKRKIVFRGLSVKTNEWVYGDLLRDKNSVFIFPRKRAKQFLANFVKVQAKTVGQFTGLYDRSSTPIYEGDIVNAKFPGASVKRKEQKGIIQWNITGFSAFWKGQPEYAICYMPEHIDVIGNIHQNVELLEKEKFNDVNDPATNEVLVEI